MLSFWFVEHYFDSVVVVGGFLEGKSSIIDIIHEFCSVQVGWAYISPKLFFTMVLV